MRTGRAILSVVLLLAAPACSPADQPVSGPIELGAGWTEVVPPAPLVVSRDEQAIRLQLAGIEDIDLDNTLELADGGRVVVDAEVVDDAGTVYPLVLAAVSGQRHAFFYRAGERPPGPDYPTDRKIVKLRLRSEPALTVEEIRWICTSAH